MIDFHSHILPQIDDGSQSVEESIALLELLRKQNVECVFATPHFDANRHSVDRFCEKRQAAYERLAAVLTPALPSVCLGAEVAYYQGVSRLNDLPRLKLEGTKLLLLEMPFSTWSEYAVRELIDLSCSGEITVLLAHIERYLKLQKKSLWDRLLDKGILMQTNATFFSRTGTRRKAVKMLSRGQIHLLGSDCHNLRARPPYMDVAAENIAKYLGDEYVAKIERFGRRMMKEKEESAF